MKRTIRLISLLVALALSVTLVACNTSVNETKEQTGSDKRVLSAINKLESDWNDEYNRRGIKDKYLEITNTKLINIKQNDDSFFSDIDYIVEFDLQTNFYESAPYYSNIGFRGSVLAVYKDGRKEVLDVNPFQRHIKLNGPTDFSDIIESIENFSGKYDQIIIPDNSAN